MAIFFSACSFNKFIFVLALYSICLQMEIVEGRFVWDLSHYCITYCSRFNEQLPLIGVCSCHRITSAHKRTNDPNYQSYRYDQSIDDYTQ
ncbi:hypothetical protein I4U23_017333 [Adineta vaga]|nr:hypothetical protein I4U23_017333 [Adineta vaga]